MGFRAFDPWKSEKPLFLTEMSREWRLFKEKIDNDYVLRNDHRIKTTQPISMIMVSLFLEDNTRYFRITKERNRAFRFLGHPVYTLNYFDYSPAPPPPPPHSGVGGTACVFPKSPVKGYFSCDKVRPQNCKKGGVFDFSPGDFFKEGVVFFLSLSISLWTPEKFKKGVIK